MKQFKYSGWTAPDVVQDENGQVWISLYKPSPGLYNIWLPVERMQSAEGDRYDRDPNGHPTTGFGTRSGRSDGESFRRPGPKPESKYGIRDHRPMTDAEHRQARLYAQMYPPEMTTQLHEWIEKNL